MQTFSKIDVGTKGFITAKNLRQGLLVNIRTLSSGSQLRNINVALYKKIESRRSKEKLNKEELLALVKDVLESDHYSNLDVYSNSQSGMQLGMTVGAARSAAMSKGL